MDSFFKLLLLKQYHKNKLYQNSKTNNSKLVIINSKFKNYAMVKYITNLFSEFKLFKKSSISIKTLKKYRKLVSNDKIIIIPYLSNLNIVLITLSYDKGPVLFVNLKINKYVSISQSNFKYLQNIIFSEYENHFINVLLFFFNFFKSNKIVYSNYSLIFSSFLNLGMLKVCKSQYTEKLDDSLGKKKINSKLLNLDFLMFIKFLKFWSYLPILLK
ncbi:26S proteasome SU A6 (nucleomorph) [Bigelowiella natans]|uniref:26S proteasome SU A6 n=1 Tax=Bigelowiella natans TaxID=227086 RepID=Q3LVX5_BIGNA|nr:26S proteasome SU A6 [Bigelowiella natans]ABA27390.1 26S proteasome SU A6 [Bigelowiella natans]